MTASPANPPRRRSRYSRRRAATLAAVYALMGIHIAHWKLAGRTLAPLEFNEVLYTLHDGVVTAGFLFMTTAVLATSIVGRFFCSWGCHILALEDLSAGLLAKIGIHPKPVRSRALGWVPALTLAYLLVWPQVERLLRGETPPALRVVSDPHGWMSFVTDDLWRNLPGPGMTVVTFAVCGFVIIYLLGSRSFCRYVCPYGAAFAVADQVAPGRIIAIGDCSKCGACTAACQSQVRVHEEVARFGTIVSSSCLKDLDCVSACPDQVLRFGFTRPPVLRSWNELRDVQRSYDFSRGEDLLMAITFLATLVAFRRLYEAVGLLLALAIAAIASYVAVLCLGLARDTRVRLNGFQLKAAGRLTASGLTFAVLALAFGAVTAHSAFIRYHVFRGEQALATMARRTDPPSSDGSAPVVPVDAAIALGHLETAAHWGWVRPDGLRRQLASLYLMTAAPAAAEAELRAILAAAPGNHMARFDLGQLLLQRRQTEAATAELEAVARNEDLRAPRDFVVRGAAHAVLARLAISAGRRSEAMQYAERATRDNPKDGDALLLLGNLLVESGRLEEAEIPLRQTARLRPDSATAHNNLAVVLTRLGRHAEAIDHYQASLRIWPDDARVQQNLGTSLYRSGELDAAARAYEAALALEPDEVAAHVGLAMVLRDRGDLEQARAYWRRAGELDDRYALDDLP